MFFFLAVDVFVGFEYLHHGCTPPIIHRDVKSTNILLTEDFRGKLADFGLSRVIPIEGGSHISTGIAGTFGYLDPEYYTSGRLTEKSDVYSFGVVLMEIITGRPAIVGPSDDLMHISDWFRSKVEEGDIKTLVDPRIWDFDLNAAGKTVELTLACISTASDDRPSMFFVVSQLKESLTTEVVGLLSVNLESDASSPPQAR